MSKPRLILFDSLKILAAFLVVNLHFEAVVLGKPLTPLFYLGWYSVPLFIVISFYFNSQNILKRIKRLLIPLLFWSGVAFAIQPATITLKHLLRQLVLGTVVDVPLYYLNMMIFLTLLFFSLSHWLKSASRWVIVILMLIFVTIEITGVNKTLVNLAPYPLQFFVIRLIEFFKYAALGLLLPKIINLVKKIPYQQWFIAGLLIIVGTKDILAQWHYKSEVIVYSGLGQFSAVGLIVLLIALFKEIKVTSFFNQAVRFISRYVLGVYCLHFLFVENLKLILNNYQIDYRTYQFPLVLLIFTGSLVIAVLIDKLSFGRLSATVS